jgi:hypothetical protein
LFTAVLVTQLLLTIGVVLVSVVVTRRQLRIAFDAGLHGRAMSVAALVRYSEGPTPMLVFDNEMAPRPLDREHPDVYRILDRNGRVIATSPNWPAGFDPTPRKGKEHWNLRVHGQPYRAVSLANVPVLDREDSDSAPAHESLTVFYAASTEELNEVVWSAGVLIVVISLALLGVATVIAVWAIVTGLLEIAAAIELRKEITGEWLLALAGIFSVLFGAAIMVWPTAGVLAVLWWIGAWAIVFGVLLITLGFRARHWGAMKASSAA